MGRGGGGGGEVRRGAELVKIFSEGCDTRDAMRCCGGRVERRGS